MATTTGSKTRSKSTSSKASRTRKAPAKKKAAAKKSPAKRPASTKGPAAKKKAAARKRAPAKKRTAKRAATRKACPTWRDYLTTSHQPGTPAKTQGRRCIDWIELHCVHTNDRWTGQPFRLLAWQKLVILSLFIVGPDGLRRIRWALVGIAKKNGKTELAAALALFFAFGPSGPDGEPEPSALVVCAAGNDDQADLVFGAAKTMCELSPTLGRLTEGHRFESEIQCPSLPGSKIRRVAAASKKTSSTLDGKNIYVVICDELHAWEGNQGRIVWETLTNAVVTRRQPLIFQITTSFFDEDTVCGEQYEYGRQVAAGKVKDPAYLMWWVEAPEGCDHRDPDVIRAANPSFGVTVELPFYLDQLTKKTEAVFRRFFLNQKTAAEEGWLEHGQWDACKVKRFDFDTDQPVFTGTDAATKDDSTATVRAQWNPKTGKLRLKLRLWERPMDPRTRAPDEHWRLNPAEVEEDLVELKETFGTELKACGYDPTYFVRSAPELVDRGVPMEEVPQSDSRMVLASQTLYQLIVREQIEHDGDPDFARHIANAVARMARGGAGGWRLHKGGDPKKKMDAAIAAAIAALLASQWKEEQAERRPVIW